MTDKKYCPRCQGAGQVDTGIMESPVTICNDCNGTGLAQQRTWVGLQDFEIKKLVGNDRYTDLLTAVAIAVEKELKARNT